MSVNINFTDEDWERLTRNWSAWWAGETDRPMVMIETSHVMIAPNETWSREFLFEKPVDEVVDYFRKVLEPKHFYGDAWPRWFPNFGPGMIAGFLGSNVRCMPDERTIWFDVDEVKPLEELHFEYDPANPAWQRVQAITRAAVERFGDRVSVGHTDLGGNLDILASFRTANRLLMEVIDAPAEVARLTGEITRVWRRYYNELYEIIKTAGRGTSGWSEIWSPGRTYMTQCDFSYMISPAMFEQFVLPDLAACYADLDHGFYHLDGKGQIVHLDLLLATPGLHGIQWIPGAGQPQPEEFLPLLRRIRDGGKRCQVYVTAAGARAIVRELGGKGFALYVVPFPVMSAEQARDFLKVLAEEDISRGW